MLVDPQEFAKAMSERWVHVLDNAPADNLPDAWAKMAETFNSHIAGECTPSAQVGQKVGHC